MRRVLIYSALLILCLVLSQLGPALGLTPKPVRTGIESLTMFLLAFIMIHVGYEFDLDKSNLGQYGVDAGIAVLAAGLPWLFCAAYFVFVLTPGGERGYDTWTESLLAGRFAAPTSAGVLFAMLSAAGLGATWMFRKARVLAIFDDLDTVLLLIPLQAMIVGLHWEMGLAVVVMLAMLAIGYRYLHSWRIPVSWPIAGRHAGATAWPWQSPCSPAAKSAPACWSSR